MSPADIHATSFPFIFVDMSVCMFVSILIPATHTTHMSFLLSIATLAVSVFWVESLFDRKGETKEGLGWGLLGNIFHFQNQGVKEREIVIIFL
jgi:hypothetical protein